MTGTDPKTELKVRNELLAKRFPPVRISARNHICNYARVDRSVRCVANVYLAAVLALALKARGPLRIANCWEKDRFPKGTRSLEPLRGTALDCG